MTGVIYAGIGARKTPDDVLRKMRNAAKSMATLGFILRSGGAEGADNSFEEGHDLGDVSGDHKEIFLPFKGFRKNESPRFGTSLEARTIARTYHPAWHRLGDLGRDFMGRNAYQIMGSDFNTPCDFVLCWTPDGKASGGTGQAIRHATAMEIPVLNFKTNSDDEISDFIFAINERTSP